MWVSSQQNYTALQLKLRKVFKIKFVFIYLFYPSLYSIAEVICQADDIYVWITASCKLWLVLA